MSNRTNGSRLWSVRPVIDGTIHEDRAELFAGSIIEVMARANALHLETGIQQAVRAYDQTKGEG